MLHTTGTVTLRAIAVAEARIGALHYKFLQRAPWAFSPLRAGVVPDLLAHAADGQD